MDCEIPEGAVLAGIPKRVGRGWPVAAVLRRFKVGAVIDSLIPHHDAREVSTGTCVEAMIASILLTGRHTLSGVASRLAEYDCRSLLGHELDPEVFNDDRLGRTLEALFKAGLSGLNTATLLHAMDVFGVEIDLIHFDTTSLKLFGDYPGGESDAENPDAAPVVERGFSKDKRPELKQVIYSMSATYGDGLPVLARVTDGGRSDSLENATHMRQLAEVFPEGHRPTLVADCKLFSGRNLVLARELGIPIVTLLPRNVGLWSELVDPVREELADAPLLRERVAQIVEQDERTGAERILEEEGLAEWRGLGTKTVYEWTDDDNVEHRIPLKALVIWSADKATRNAGSLRSRIDSEERRLSRSIKKLEREAFHCEKDAVQALAAFHRIAKPKFHYYESSIEAEQRPKARGRGRPKKGEVRELETVWRVEVYLEECEELIEVNAIEQCCFVIVTTGDLRPSEALAVYKSQQTVENQIRWAKVTGCVAPIFLKTPSRIAALGYVYLLAMLVRGIIQRDVRLGLAESQRTIAGNPGQGRTQRPTAEVIFRHFDNGLQTIPLRLPDGQLRNLLVNHTTEQALIMELLGAGPPESSGLSGTPREPRGSERGARKGRPLGMVRRKRVVCETRGSGQKFTSAQNRRH